MPRLTDREWLGQMRITRGPFYRKLCVTIIDRVAALCNRPLGFHDARDVAMFEAGWHAGCEACSRVIRHIDDPTIELDGRLARWNTPVQN